MNIRIINFKEVRNIQSNLSDSNS